MIYESGGARFKTFFHFWEITRTFKIEQVSIGP